MTVDELKQYMEDILSDTADKLGLSKSGADFDEAAAEVALTLEVSDVATVSDSKLLRMVARVEAWRTVMYATVHESSHSAGAPGTGNTSRADIHRHAKAMYELTLNELHIAYPDVIGNMASVSKVPLKYNDPYERNGTTANEWSRVT